MVSAFGRAMHEIMFATAFSLHTLLKLLKATCNWLDDYKE